MYDHATGEVRYNFVHTPDAKNQPDTLYLNPVGRYDITVHTTPPVRLTDVELNPGKHNIIGIDVPLGVLSLVEGASNTFNERQCVMRSNATGEIIYVQNFNTKMKYLSGVYDIEILTLPRIHYEDYELKGGIESKIEIPLSGNLTISTTDNILYSVFVMRGDKMEKVFDSQLNSTSETIQLLPGDYKIISRSNIKKVAASTKEFNVQIKSAKTTTLKI